MLDLYWQRYPFRAAADGLHQYDGQAGAWDARSLDDYVRNLSAFQQPREDHDGQLIHLTALAERFWYQELGWHTVCPMVYLEPVDVSGYLKRNYAPEQERSRAAARHVAQIPEILEQARKHLKGPTSASMFRQAASSAEEYAEFYRTDVSRFCGEGAEKAADALARFAAWLEERAQKAPEQYSMGEAQFERLLEVTQGYPLSAERVEKLAHEELQRNLERGQKLGDGHLDQLAHDAGAAHFSADCVIAEATSIVRSLREFLHERQLVSTPGDSEVKVCPSPAGARWSFASMDSPGPFEESEEAFYYITLPDPHWPVQEQEEWMSAFEPGLLHMITLHESLPGHFVHKLHMRRISPDVRKALRSYTFTEGWAHYCEEMMVEVGYQGNVSSKTLELSQILAALDRCCRLIASVRLHCAGETPLEVARIFRENAFMEPARALCSARRGAFDPEYGDYTLGKLMLRKIRADQPHLGLREFHDQILSWGSPPPWLLRRSLGLTGEPL